MGRGNQTDDERPAHAWAWLFASVAAYASTISLGALASRRVDLTSDGARQALTFGPVQLVRYVLAGAAALVAMRLVGKRRGGHVVLRHKSSTRLWLGLALPQLFASGLLYLAFTYGSAAVAAALLFSSVFFSVAISLVEDPGVRGRIARSWRLQAAGISFLAVFVAGMVVLATANERIFGAGAVRPDFGLTLALGLMAGASLAVFLWQAAKVQHIDGRERTAAVCLMTAVLSAAVTVAWAVVPGSTSVVDAEQLTSVWTVWPVACYGLATFVATEAMFRSVAIGHGVRSAMLTLEPIFVLGFALAPPFSFQLPKEFADAGLQIAACATMVVGAMGAAILTRARASKPETKNAMPLAAS